jgi:ethanolamine phosphate transferase 2 subunit G
MSIILENTAQILNVVKMAFPKFLSDPERSSAQCYQDIHTTFDKLECYWLSASLSTTNGLDNETSHAAFQKAQYRFLHEAQSVMSGAASSYKLSMLYSGSFIAAVACIIAAIIAYCTLPKTSSSSSSTLFLLTTSTLHGAMMFASSFVEEEQQFWYWIATSWAVYIHLRS